MMVMIVGKKAMVVMNSLFMTGEMMVLWRPCGFKLTAQLTEATLKSRGGSYNRCRR